MVFPRNPSITLYRLGLSGLENKGGGTVVEGHGRRHLNRDGVVDASPLPERHLIPIKFAQRNDSNSLYVARWIRGPQYNGSCCICEIGKGCDPHG